MHEHMSAMKNEKGFVEWDQVRSALNMDTRSEIWEDMGEADEITEDRLSSLSVTESGDEWSDDGFIEFDGGWYDNHVDEDYDDEENEDEDEDEDGGEDEGYESEENEGFEDNEVEDSSEDEAGDEGEGEDEGDGGSSGEDIGNDDSGIDHPKQVISKLFELATIAHPHSQWRTRYLGHRTFSSCVHEIRARTPPRGTRDGQPNKES